LDYSKKIYWTRDVLLILCDLLHRGWIDSSQPLRREGTENWAFKPEAGRMLTEIIRTLLKFKKTGTEKVVFFCHRIHVSINLLTQLFLQYPQQEHIVSFRAHARLYLHVNPKYFLYIATCDYLLEWYEISASISLHSINIKRREAFISCAIGLRKLVVAIRSFLLIAQWILWWKCCFLSQRTTLCHLLLKKLKIQIVDADQCFNIR